MRLLNTVYLVDHHARASVRNKALEVRIGREVISRFPLEAIEAVMLMGGASISTEAIGRCAERGIRVASVQRSGRVRFVVTPRTSGNVNLRLAHYRTASDPTAALRVAQSCVAGKLQNARRLLLRWADAASGSARRHIDDQRRGLEERLLGVPSARNGDVLRGIEGDATRRYFKGLGRHLDESGSPFPFLLRSRRPPRDPVNAALSYGYGLLAVSCQGALDAVGLDPQVGFLHGARPGRSSLALDLMEEFRPALIDRFVVSLFARRQLGRDDFIVTAGGACYLSDEGRRKFLSRYDEDVGVSAEHPLLRQAVPRSLLPSVQATLLARALRGDLPSYAPYLIQR